MTVTRPTAEPDTEKANLRTVMDELRLPEGFRAEIIEGNIVVSPAPLSLHNLIFALLMEQLLPARPADCKITNSQAVTFPPAEGSEVEEQLVPDLIVCPTAALREHRASLPAGALLLAVEITSRASLHIDREVKRDTYARARVPLYLLVDPHDNGGHLTLHARSRDGAYQEIHRLPFGEKVCLPEPFELDLDTSEFPTS